MTRVKSANVFKALSAGKQMLIVLVPIALGGAVIYVFPAAAAGNILFGLFVAAVGTLFLYVLRNRSRLAWGEFTCPSCKDSIQVPLENGGTHGEPILYFCRACDILWHVGNTDRY